MVKTFVVFFNVTHTHTHTLSHTERYLYENSNQQRYPIGFYAFKGFKVNLFFAKKIITQDPLSILLIAPKTKRQYFANNNSFQDPKRFSFRIFVLIRNSTRESEFLLVKQWQCVGYNTSTGIYFQRINQKASKCDKWSINRL